VDKQIQLDPNDYKIAYFTFEIGLSAEIPTYAGGLGILAGDTVKSFADMGFPVVAITLLNEKGYFYQEIDDEGNQIEVPVEWDYRKHMHLMPGRVIVHLDGRDIIVQAWVHHVEGITGDIVPVIFLDTNIGENHEEDRKLTQFLYGGDHQYRMKQEAIIGIAGVRILIELGFENIEGYHMNEGHSAFLTLELMKHHDQDLETVRDLCVFTTHTPIPAGHDRFDIEAVERVFGDYIGEIDPEDETIIDHEGLFNMTLLALKHSKYVNGVAKKHGEVTREMFPEYEIDAITNGIHVGTWVCYPMSKVFDEYMPSWRNDPYTLRGALTIPREKLWKAHQSAKKKLLDFVNYHYKTDLNIKTLTIGFARRATSYKRADLLFKDIDRLLKIVEDTGKIQIIFGGKAHPKDTDGKKLIKEIHDISKELKDKITIVYLKNYDIYSAKLLVAGVDVWLNTPLRPLEASGTSGMKAAVNGVLNFSVMDGWWIEGYIKNFTGWKIGPMPGVETDEKENNLDMEDLYIKLEKGIIPTYYNNRKKWEDMMACNIALNGSFFNTHRMVSQYVMKAYFI